MSIGESVNNFINSHFREPVVFALIAKMLREGAQMVKVKYRNRVEYRYYTGTGYPCNDKWGKRKRWMMEVHRFEQDKTDGICRFVSLGLPAMDKNELELLLDWSQSNISIISEVKFFDVGVDVVKNELINIVRRLKPGQGYKFQGYHVLQDLIQPDGLMLHNGRKYLVPDQYIASQIMFNQYIPEQSFDPNQIFVADPKVIKRQHRPNNDLERWVVVKQVPSVEDSWAIRYTHKETAGAPVFYYSVDINIDSKAMKAHPFYITELANDALRQIMENHKDGHYDLDQEAITITWDGQTKPLLTWLDHARRFPASLDEQPNVVYKKLNSEATIVRFNGLMFAEVEDDKA